MQGTQLLMDFLTMRVPRIYHPEMIVAGSEIALSEEAANHVGRVLRMGAGQAIQLFDGSNQVFEAQITRADKKKRAGEYLAWRNRRS